MEGSPPDINEHEERRQVYRAYKGDRDAVLAFVNRIAPLCAQGLDVNRECPCGGRLHGQVHSKRWIEHMATDVNREPREVRVFDLPF